MNMPKIFNFSNTNLRIDSPAKTHHTDRILWASSSLEVWEKGDWNRFLSNIDHFGVGRGSTKDANFIQEVLNILGKYVGKLTPYAGITQADKDFLQIDDVMAEELFNQLKSVHLGGSGTALSLVNYITGEGAQTAQNAGFSFESRFSELIQRLAGKQDFDIIKEKRKIKLKKPELITKGKKKGQYRTERIEIKITDERKSLRTGQQMVKVGNNILSDAIDIVENIENDVVENLEQGIKNQSEESKKIGKIGYMVPDKADIRVPLKMQIYTEYSPIITKFLEAVRGKSFSLKNTSQSIIKIGSTNDDQRLKGFASQFFNGRFNSAGIATFIYASRRAGEQKGDTQVLRYTNWARIFYELMGAGQFDKMGNELFVDYIIINSYKPDGTSGYINVFTVQDLLKNAPESDPTQIFKIASKDGHPYAGPIELNLTTQLPKQFIFAR